MASYGRFPNKNLVWFFIGWFWTKTIENLLRRLSNDHWRDVAINFQKSSSKIIQWKIMFQTPLKPLWNHTVSDHSETPLKPRGFRPLWNPSETTRFQTTLKPLWNHPVSDHSETTLKPHGFRPLWNPSETTRFQTTLDPLWNHTVSDPSETILKPLWNHHWTARDGRG